MSKILIADDSRFHQTLLKKALEDKGFELIFAEDGLHASMLALRAQPNAIVLDLRMPGGSGMEVLKRIRRSEKTKSIPVVVVTACDDPAARETVRSLGASEFFEKPVNLDQLVQKISDLVKSSNSGKRAVECVAVAPLPIPAERVVSAETLPKPVRSWREIIQDVAENDHK